ncbi:MAG: NAD(P)H-quinone oxidoreductase subunit L [Geitlerinemataceae cyanobacterium]
MTLTPNILALLLYAVLAGTYLVVVPLALYFYLSKRWYVAGSIERFFAYFLVFMFFPGMIAFAPFLNLRPQKRELGA